ncbi:MAG: response regulator [Pyrinomonadaceae bacterium]
MSAAERRPLHVLVVDDHLASVEALVRLLRHEGCEAFQASNVAQAMRIAQSRRLDVLVADITLPDGDGRELLRRVSALHPRVRGIAVTGHAGIEYEDTCRRAGYERMFTKPLLFAQLLVELFPVFTPGRAEGAGAPIAII